MKTIIAGSRSLGYKHLQEVLGLCSFADKITTVVSGGAKGIDKAGEEWASIHGHNKMIFHADWKRYGMGAGHKRNKDMAEFGEALIAIWDGISPGTKNMIAEAKARGLKIFVYDFSLDEYYEC